MDLIVQKFGGSSLGAIDRIKHVAERVAKRRAEGVSLVVVVSAMQGETDRLLGLARAMSARPDPRETDQLLATGEQVAAALLAMALKDLDVPARSLTAQQMKLRTSGEFSRARIKRLEGGALHEALVAGEVVVVTGFQGIDEKGNVTTLGRGGSDTSAVALAAALGARECEIYTDVLGVFSADPRLVPEARKLEIIAFDDMLEMASQGAKVLQIRSVELAMNHAIALRVRSTFSADAGTLVCSEDEVIERMVVTGVSHNENESKITVRDVPDHPGGAAAIFGALAQSGINVDVIVQSAADAGSADLSFTVDRLEHQEAARIVREVAERMGARVDVDDAIAKVSIVGVGMRTHPGVAAVMFATLAQQNINIQMISTSEIKVTCVIARNRIRQAVQALHEAFDLARTGDVPGAT